jgi:hypothetical protein
MPNPIKLKRSAVAAAVPSSLEFGELALNYNVADGKLYYKNSAGTIVAFETGGGNDARWDYFKPAAPTSVTATAGNAQAVVSWTAPAVVVPPVTDYVVQFSSNSGSSWTTFSDGTSTSTSATVTGLTNDTAYVFRVAAVNGIGTGEFSAGSAAVTPVLPVVETISGLQLWLDASDSSTLFDATTGGSLVAADGAVARWQDKSGNARHATQATSGFRPTRKLAQSNGLASLLFPVSSGTAENSGTCLDVSLTLSQPFTLVAVVRAKRTDAYLCDGTSDAARVAIGTDLNGTSPGQWGMYNTGVVEGGGNAASVWKVIVSRWNGSSSTIRLNGSDSGSGTVGSGGIAGLRIGSRLNNAFSGADVGEMAVYSSSLSAEDVATLESHLISKWGIV